jgi:1-acyl-sn-glycerol-3-phosphate acyltransferase
MELIFIGNEYHTPPNTPHHWGDKLAFGTRWYFMLCYILIIIRARILVALNYFDDTWYIKTNLSIFRLIEGCSGRFHITGLEHLHNCSSPVIIVSNHMSNIETNALGCVIWPYQKLTYVAKASLLKFPVFGPVLAWANPIAVGRASPREDLLTVLQEGAKRLQSGISIILFPQSTRSVEFHPEKFNTLGEKLARRANVPILPMVVKTDFWANGRSFWRDFGPLQRHEPIHIAFGQALLVEGNGKQTHEHIIEFIQIHLRQWAASGEQ